MRRYASDGNQNAAVNVSILGLTSTTTIRPHLYEFTMGCGDTPADQAVRIELARYTAAGTATGVTPTPLDPADPNAAHSAGENHTVEPTYSGPILMTIPLNQQATFRWAVLPEDGLVMPATAANGIGFRFRATDGVSGGTALWDVSAFVAE